MSNRTWVCLACEKSYRRDSKITELPCALCHQPCEYVHWKLHIPSPRRKREWSDFWTRYRLEKQLLKQFENDPRIKEVELELLSRRLTRR